MAEDKQLKKSLEKLTFGDVVEIFGDIDPIAAGAGHLKEEIAIYLFQLLKDVKDLSVKDVWKASEYIATHLGDKYVMINKDSYTKNK